MPRGGARSGAGRKATASVPIKNNVKQQLTDILAERVKDMDITPLEVMMRGMKLHYDDSRKALLEAETIEGKDAKEFLVRTAKAEMAAASTYAKDVAPYIHAKLQTTTIKGDKESPLEIALGLTSIEDLRKAIRGK